MTKLAEINEGDKVQVDDNFDCMAGGAHLVEKDKNGLFVRCGAGKHYLDGQQDYPGADLVGITKA